MESIIMVSDSLKLTEKYTNIYFQICSYKFQAHKDNPKAKSHWNVQKDKKSDFYTITGNQFQPLLYKCSVDLKVNIWNTFVRLLI